MEEMTIVVADRHPVVRSGIKYIVKTQYPYAHILEAANGDETIVYCKQHTVALLLMDLNMPDTDSHRMIHTLLAFNPSLKILIHTVDNEEVFGPLYLKMGAKGFVSKKSPEQEMIKAIKIVLDGGIYIHEQMREFYLNNVHRDNPYDTLTPKEKEVLRHLVKGHSATDICRIMNIGATTVSTHKAHIFEKLKIDNLIELKSLADTYPL